MELVDIHRGLEKQAADEFHKLAEEDAAGRIMARGFMDELNKVASDWLGRSTIGSLVRKSLLKIPAVAAANSKMERGSLMRNGLRQKAQPSWKNPLGRGTNLRRASRIMNAY